MKLAGLVATFLLAAAAALPALAGGPHDIVPRGDITYDHLGALAAAGRLPGYTLRDFARGDRLYTRAEIARIVAPLGDGPAAAEEAFAAARRALRVEFARELSRFSRGPLDYANSAPPAEAGLLTGTLKIRGLTDPLAGGSAARVSGTLPVGRDGYAAFSGGSRNEFYAQAEKRYPAVETAFVRINGRALDVWLGQMPLRWGPGYDGALLLSDESRAIPQVRVEKNFALPGRLGRRIGPLYFSQFAGQFFESDDPSAPANARGSRRYVFGRRFETNGNRGPWSLSFTESFKSTRLPDGQWALLLPFYVYQRDWTRQEPGAPRLFGFLATSTQPDTFWLNFLADLNVSYRADQRVAGTTFYADLLVDDLQAPVNLGKNDSVPRKIGFQVGVHAPDLGGLGRYGLRLEYASIDAGTYTSLSPPVAWNQQGLPLGHPAGPDARVFFARVDARLSPRVDLALEGRVRRRARGSEGSSANRDALGVYATYALRANAFVGTRLDYERAPRALPEQTRTRFELNAAVGF